MREELIKEIYCRDRGKDDYAIYLAMTLPSLKILAEATHKMLNSFPIKFGSCVMMSVGFIAALEVHYSVKAIAVIGDLNIYNKTIFKCINSIPTPKNDENIIDSKWDGHCWVEVGPIICDLSIFRSAYNINRPSVLKEYILSNFGAGKGALISPIHSIPKGMEYIPKFILNEVQIQGILNGLTSTTIAFN